MYKISLTQSQVSALDVYLRRTTQLRKKEQASYESLAAELDESGAPQYPGAAANVKWWAETEIALQEVLVALDQAEEITGPVTNADMIRAMPDDELADTLMCPNESGLGGIECDHSDNKNCSACCRTWLKSECVDNGYGDLTREEDAI